MRVNLSPQLKRRVKQLFFCIKVLLFSLFYIFAAFVFLVFDEQGKALAWYFKVICGAVWFFCWLIFITSMWFKNRFLFK